MKDFIMLFHSEPSPNMDPSPEEMQAELKKWEEWMGAIGAKGKLKNPGEALGYDGKTLHGDGTVTDGPYVEVKEFVGGFIIVSTDTIDEALALAEGCPVLANGGKVEVRDIMVFG